MSDDISQINKTQTLRFGSLDPAQFYRAWNWGILATMLGTVYLSVCVDVPRTKFLTALGFTPFHLGLMSGLTAFTIVFQLLAGILARYLNWRKRFWFAAMITQRILFGIVLLTPFLLRDMPSMLIWGVIAILFVHDAAGNLGNPLWLSWMSDLVPRDQMNVLWGRRLRLMTFSQMLATVVVAFAMQYYESRNNFLNGFMIIAWIGALTGVAEILLFNAKVPENYNNPDREGTLWQALTRPVRDKTYRPFIWFLSWWTFSYMYSYAFFPLYQIRSMQMPILWVQMTIVALLVGLAVGAPVFGVIADTYGSRCVMQFSLYAKHLSLLPYFLIPNDPRWYWLFPALLWFDGIFNAATTIAVQHSMFTYSPAKQRTMYIAVAQCIALGVAGCISPTLAGIFVEHYELSGFPVPFTDLNLNAYHAVFITSLILRLGCFPLSSSMPSTGNISTFSVAKTLATKQSLILSLTLLKHSLARTAQQRVALCRRLGQIGHPMGVTALLQDVGHRDYAVRQAAALALGAIGSDKATATLAHAMTDRTGGIGEDAALALGKIGGQESLHHLLKNLTKVQDPATLIGIIEALAEIGDCAAILPLVCMMDRHGNNAPVRSAIVRALRRLSRGSSEAEVLALFRSEQS